MARRPQTAQKVSLKPILWVFMFALVMVIFPSVVMVLVMGMLPSIVAFLIDRAPKKYAGWSVSAMNLVGVYPALESHWTGTTTIPEAIKILSNPLELIVMYSAAAFGWMIYVAVPPVVRSVMSIIAQHRIAQLRSDQRNLIGEWGAGIASEAAELDVIGTGKNMRVRPGSKRRPHPAREAEKMAEAAPPPETPAADSESAAVASNEPAS